MVVFVDLSDDVRKQQDAYIKSLEEKQRQLEADRNHVSHKEVPRLALPQPSSQLQYLPVSKGV